MSDLAAAAFAAGFKTWGISPHSPVCCESCANMKFWDVNPFLHEVSRLKEEYSGRMKVLGGMEIDYISKEFGPHIDYFRELPLDYRIGSVHFVPTKEGRPVDVDGKAERFLRYLHDDFNDDLRYVVETYFKQELDMIRLGGFDIIGHLDKIGDNGSAAHPGLEDEPWYAELVEKTMRAAVDAGLTIEINTKAYRDKGRFFPNLRWWPMLKRYGARLVISTDAHYPEKVDAGYNEARLLLEEAGMIDQLRP